MCLVCRFQRSCGFELEKDGTRDKKISLEGSNHMAAKPRLKGKVFLDHETRRTKRDHHGFTIDGLEEAEAEFVVDLIENTDDAAGKPFMLESAFICVHLRLRLALTMPNSQF